MLLTAYHLVDDLDGLCQKFITRLRLVTIYCIFLPKYLTSLDIAAASTRENIIVNISCMAGLWPSIQCVISLGT
jgi:hypothetical protein